MIQLEHLTIHQGNFTLSEIDLSIPDGEYGILMGPTGCGKTTLLEAICGLRRISAGRILIGNRDISQLAPAHRQIGYVPQDSALFPSMRVGQQIEFGLRVRNVQSAIRKQRVEELAGLLEIDPLLDRYPDGLSGGEQQRVAMARALSFGPKLLCLDEPLSALDDSTRQRMTELLRVIHRDEKVTVLHITHNLDEGQHLGTIQFRFSDGKINCLPAST